MTKTEKDKTCCASIFQQSARDQLPYVVFILRKMASSVIVPFQRMLWLHLHPSFLLGQPAPIHPKNLTMAYDFAFAKHQFGAYSGKGFLLRTGEIKAGFDEAADRGWGRIFAEGLEIYEIPGDHLSMLEIPMSERLVGN